MELETYCIAERIYKELDNNKHNLFCLEDEYKRGYTHIFFGHDCAIKLEGESLEEVKDVLCKILQSRIKILEQQFKEL